MILPVLQSAHLSFQIIIKKKSSKTKTNCDLSKSQSTWFMKPWECEDQTVMCYEQKGDAGGICGENNCLTNSLCSYCSNIESVLKPFMCVVFLDPQWLCSHMHRMAEMLLNQVNWIGLTALNSPLQSQRSTLKFVLEKFVSTQSRCSEYQTFFFFLFLTHRLFLWNQFD